MERVGRFARIKVEPIISQRQSITQKGVHAHPLTAREREHWFLQHLSDFLAANFGRQWREHPFVRYFGALPYKLVFFFCQSIRTNLFARIAVIRARESECNEVPEKQA